MLSQVTDFQELANLSVELLEESEHVHPIQLPSEMCPHCWTRKMAIDLMDYMWNPRSARVAVAA